MKLTRYFQSCFVLEEGGARLLFDPSGQEADNTDKFGSLDAVIYTHEHVDHFDADLAEKFAQKGVAIYANASTAKQMKSQPNIVADGQELEIKGVKIKAVELPHCLLWDGSVGPQNTGYLVGGKFFTPGDGVVGAEGVKADLLAVPITGPDISLKDAMDFTKQLGAKKVVPIHYDFIGTKPEVFARVAQGFEVLALANGESAEL